MFKDLKSSTILSLFAKYDSFDLMPSVLPTSSQFVLPGNAFYLESPPRCNNAYLSNSWQLGQTLEIVFFCVGNYICVVAILCLHCWACFALALSPFLRIINFIWQTCKHSQFCLLASHLHHIHHQHNDDATIKDIFANIIIQTLNILPHKNLQFVIGL